MPQHTGPESNEARQRTVTAVLTELRRQLDEQFRIIDGLDSKAGVLFGAASLLITLGSLSQGLAFRAAAIGRLPPSNVVLGVLVVAVVLYAAIVFCLMRGLRIRVYQLPMKADWDHLERTYLRGTSDEAEEQLLVDYVARLKDNWILIQDKAEWTKRGFGLLGVELIYLLIVVAVGVTLILD